MKPKTISKAVRVINRSIKLYQEKLNNQLELKTKANFNNGNFKNPNLDDYDSTIEKYEIILSDLAEIKKAINSGKSDVNLYATSYAEFSEVLEEAGLDIDKNPDGTMYLCPIEEWEEEEKMAVQREFRLHSTKLIRSYLGI